MADAPLRRRRPSRDLAIGALVVAPVLALGLTAGWLTRSVELERRAASDERTLAAVSVAVRTALDQTLDRAADAALMASAGLSGAGFIPTEQSEDLSSELGLRPGSATAAPAVAALDRARDTGVPVLSPPVELVAGPRLLAVAAVYGEASARERPASTAERRAAILGWVVETVDPGSLLSGRTPARTVAAVRDGPFTWSIGGPSVPERLPSGTIDAHGHRLEVRAGDPSAIPLHPRTIALLGATVLFALAAAATAVELIRRIHATRVEAADRVAQIRLIGDVGPLVQQSLELAEVLPAIAIQLSDHFGLSGVSLSRYVPGGAAVDLFSIGTAPAAGTKPVLRPPELLRAGATLVLALERGGRSVAQLRLVAGRELDEAQLQSLRAITELITAAVANASLYASQQQALRQLRDLDALKTGFLGTASHELRTPVTAIAGFASLLLASWDRFDNEQRQHFVERIGANAQSLAAVVQDLLDFSLLDRGSIVLSPKEIDLGALVSNVVDRLAPVLDDHEIELLLTPAPTIVGDVNGLERVVSNLLTNAAKFSPPATMISVTVGPAADDGYGAEVVVCDEGPGIPQEERQQVFARFFRGSGDEVLRTRGVGIGLSVVAELVALLHGEVEVGEAPGGGARFTLRFPAASEATV